MEKWTIAEIPSQSGRLAIVTGANSGIGWNTALELARAGSRVILAARTEAKGDEAVARILKILPRAEVRAEVLDLASLRSVRTFAEKVGKEEKLDLIVNNAGVMAVPQRKLTEDGFELQFGTNYLGHFALTGLLMPALLRSKSPRVTTVSSGAANMGTRKINFDNLQWENTYGPWKAYCQSKLANLMFMLELGRRSEAAGVNLLSTGAHPGYARTNLQTTGPARELTPIENWLSRFISQDAAHGALPTLRAATAPYAEQGSYYAPDRIFHLKGDPILVKLPKPAKDAAAASRLWQVSEKLTGISFLSD